MVDRAIRDAFPDEIWVEGAISGLNRSAAGHVYFDLVQTDELGEPGAASIPVALFANAKHRVNAILKRTNSVRMHDGVEIKIRGSVAFYERQGRVQLIMSLIDPSFTLGQLEQARAVLIAKLREEGLLDANRLLDWPLLPLRIALITSSGSAAEADFLNHLGATGLPFEVAVFDCRVQGDDAPPQIAAAIDQASENGTAEFDVVAVVRGGGARTDLVAFDHEIVARAIATCHLPVIVGVGHETDRSVADDVAHISTKTPTACANLLIDTVVEFNHRVTTAGQRIGQAALTHLGRADLRLAAHRATLGQVAIEAVATRSGHLDQLVNQISTEVAHELERATLELDRHEVRIKSLDPARALARGWSITHRPDGTLVRSPADVATGDNVVTTMAGGTITSTVQTVAPDSSSSPTSHPTTEDSTP